MEAQAIRSDWAGEVIDGRFVLLQWLGGSRRSGVFLTELPGPQARKAAIKLTFAESEEDMEAHMAGWSATRPLSYPHLMRLLHTGRCEMGDGILLFSVTEYAEEVLSEILPERALTPDEAREMLAPILSTLAYLHGKDLVHGHLKPSNIMVLDDKVKISGDSLQEPVETGKPVLDLTIYDAPERAGGTISPSGDLWSLGVMLVEALTQQPPSWNKSEDDDPVVPKSIPQPFAGIARECLRADPLARCTLDNVMRWLESGLPRMELVEKAERRAARNLAPSGMPESNVAPSRMEPSKLPPSGFPAGAYVVAAVILVATVGTIAWRSLSSRPSVPTAAAQSEVQQQTAATTPETQSKEQPVAATSDAQAREPATPAAPQASAPVPDETPVVAQVSMLQTQSPASQGSKVSGAAGPAMSGTVAEQGVPEVLPSALSSIHGTVNVKVRVAVDQSGNVRDATYESEGPSRYFAKVALQAAQKWKFKPAQAGGQAAASAWILHFQFTQAGAGVTRVAANLGD